MDNDEVLAIDFDGEEVREITDASELDIKVYLVGGAVRDLYMGRAHKDTDYVVVGATPFEMENLYGFKQVGADFPVFLHPLTGDEFALARTERKSGSGYHGFEVYYDIDVTIEEDLMRRDLTMNAMAIEVNPAILMDIEKSNTIGEIIDPYGGREDIDNKLIKHTSKAFAEDPLRVLRAARFAARYHFSIDLTTIDMMIDLVSGGEFYALPTERIYAEFEKAMMEDYPELFFYWLFRVGAADHYFKELLNYNNSALRFGVSIGATFEERVMLLLSGLSLYEAKTFLTRIKAPNALVDQVTTSSEFEAMVVSLTKIRLMEGTNKDQSSYIYRGLKDMNAWKKVRLIQNAAKVQLYWGCVETFKSVRDIMNALQVTSGISFASLTKEQQDTLEGAEIGQAIDKIREETIIYDFDQQIIINDLGDGFD